jgi:hypothetical protein
MGGILQDSINEMGAKAVLKGGGNPLGDPRQPRRPANGDSGRMEKPGSDFQKFGKDVCSRVVSLEDSRKALVGSLK